MLKTPPPSSPSSSFPHHLGLPGRRQETNSALEARKSSIMSPHCAGLKPEAEETHPYSLYSVRPLRQFLARTWGSSINQLSTCIAHQVYVIGIARGADGQAAGPAPGGWRKRDEPSGSCSKTADCFLRRLLAEGPARAAASSCTVPVRPPVQFSSVQFKIR